MKRPANRLDIDCRRAFGRRMLFLLNRGRAAIEGGHSNLARPQMVYDLLTSIYLDLRSLAAEALLQIEEDFPRSNSSGTELIKASVQDLLAVFGVHVIHDSLIADA